MSDSKDEEIRAIMDALRAEYGPELVALVRALRDTIEDARRHPGDVAKLREAIASAHRIHGTAGSYEFFEVSDAAGRIEGALAPWKSRGDVPESTWAEVEQALIALEQAT